MTAVPHVSATTSRDRALPGATAGILAGPFFLGLVLLNTWLSQDFLHSLGWKLFGGEDVPYPSCLALGPHGWMQIAAFAGTGLLVIAFAVGLRPTLPRRPSSTLAVVLLGLFGLSIAASSARVDWTMVNGGNPTTPNGWVHGLAFGGVLLSIFPATVVLGLALRRDQSWRPFAIVSPLVGVALILSLILGPHGQASFLVFLAILFAWITALALRQRRLVRMAGEL